MIRSDILFFPFFAVSLALHGLLLVVFVLLPGGATHDAVDIYRIEIVEAPSLPKAKVLQLTDKAIDALKLEAPSLETNLIPTSEAPPAPKLAPPKMPSLPTLSPPAAAESTRRSQVAPQAPQLPLGGRSAPGSAALPPAPLPPAPPSPADAAATKPSSPPRPPAAPLDTGNLARPTPLEALREKVQQLELTVETPQPLDANSPVAKRRNPLALRRYQGRIQQEVKRNYTFPGEFPQILIARVRVVIARNGDKLNMEIIESSGNQRFDYTVLLTLRSTKFPPIPEEIEGDTLTQTFLFSPN